MVIPINLNMLDRNVNNLSRQNMTFADVLWFLKKDKDLYGTMIAETIGLITEKYKDDLDVTYHDIWKEALTEMQTWRQD